jgi:hypothetical protein
MQLHRMDSLHGESGHPSSLDHPLGFGQLPPGKDHGPDEVVEHQILTGDPQTPLPDHVTVVLDDRVQQHAPLGRQDGAARVEERVVAFPAEVFERADAHDPVHRLVEVLPSLQADLTAPTTTTTLA